MFYLFIIFILSPVRGQWSPIENPNLYHGDILRFDDLQDRNAIPTNERRWPDGVIPYKMDRGVDDIKDDILKAMKHIMDKTCIKFVPWDGIERGYIKIFPGDGCYSYKGRIGKIQPVSLGYGCEPIGTIIHELTHAIGFDHEQNRSDRDDYLVIFWQNIKPGTFDQFDKLKPDENRLINEFDYDSIMLYGQKTFSRDGFSKTMKPKKKGAEMIEVAKKTQLSESDVYRINTLYECKGKIK
ncbi:astacin-like metalloprotease toxin 5 [Uloborus diversus]|uniref:astacin-like metalloprotease toxin 5 n=1 Tax=Uloborus diversus TaxID=327109 RepID=UPI00240A3FCC|nr:astacin-like metalloprotease toxin 5 [Uloborus diversus]